VRFYAVALLLLVGVIGGGSVALYHKEFLNLIGGVDSQLPEVQKAGIKIRNAWTHPEPLTRSALAPAVARVHYVHFEIENVGVSEDKLLSVHAPAAERTEIAKIAFGEAIPTANIVKGRQWFQTIF